MKYPKCRNYHPKEKVDFEPVSPKTSDCQIRHYMLDIFNGYAWIILKRAPWYIWIYSIFVFLYDLFMKNGLHNLIRLYTTRVVDPGGILGQYKDIIEECQPSLAAGKILEIILNLKYIHLCEWTSNFKQLYRIFLLNISPLKCCSNAQCK